MNQHKRIVIFLQVLFGFSASAFLAMMPFILPNFQASSNVISLSGNDHDRANSVAYSPDGKVIAVGAASGIYYFDADSNQKLRFVPTETWVRSIAFSPNGSLLATGSYDPIARLWDPRTGELIAELSGHSAWIRSIAFSPDGNLLATASDDDTVRLWDPTTMESILTLEENVTGVRSVAFSSNGQLLATGGSDNIVRLWNSTDGTLERELVGHEGWVRSLAFSPDGQFLASGGFDADILLWKLDDGTLLRKLDSHSSSVLSLAFSPDGKLLASGSVDTTVRLWEIPNGDPLDLLASHSDFVFGVAFSPDGKQIVSGAVDNTIRVWDVAEEQNLLASESVSSPSNCVACHHSSGPNVPPRVIEVGCSTCHGESALVLNWCPWFPRTAGETTVQFYSDYLLKDAGIPNPGKELMIEISSVGNGEHLYSQAGIISSIPIQGTVFSTSIPPTDIDVHLEIWNTSELIDSLITSPKPNGTFIFTANLRSGGDQIQVGSFGTQRNCTACHTEAEIILPAGEIHLIAYATAPDGTIAYDERVISNDQSTTTTLSVQLLGEDGQSTEALTVHAWTRLYEWRGRTFTATSNSDGWVNLEVEALSMAPTIYQVSVPPVVIDGIWYEGMETANVTINPGDNEIPELTIVVRERSGRIEGQISGSPDAVEIYAIHLPEGEVVAREIVQDGKYSFANLPIGSYLIALDETWDVQTSVDLEQIPNAIVNFDMEGVTENTIVGTVTESNGDVIPFAWISAGNQTTWSDPLSGSFRLSELLDDKLTITVGAAGFYSQTLLVTNSGDSAPLAVNLVQRADTETILWGEGQIILPSETIAHRENQTIIFEQGWLWGQGGSEQALSVHLDEGVISIIGGTFALERLPGKSAWFFLFEGQATVSLEGFGDPVKLSAGEMINLSASALTEAVQYDPVAVRALRDDFDTPMTEIWQPGMDVILREWTGGAAILIAQIITVVTYFAAVIALFAFPAVIVTQILRRRRSKRK